MTRRKTHNYKSETAYRTDEDWMPLIVFQTAAASSRSDEQLYIVKCVTDVQIITCVMSEW